jgi:hypothetical protein
VDMCLHISIMEFNEHSILIYQLACPQEFNDLSAWTKS